MLPEIRARLRPSIGRAGRPERIAGRLEPDVPRDVEAGAHQDERDDERVHARTLAADVPPLQIRRAGRHDRRSRRRKPHAPTTTPAMAITTDATMPTPSHWPNIGWP